MPIANGFLDKEDFEREFFFELKVGFCGSCQMVQLAELVAPEKMFHEQYAFFSSTSVRMSQHFKNFANDVVTNYIHVDNPFVVELGSNDGIMLQHIANRGMRHLGIEPSANVARVATEKGIRTLCKFFDEDVAREIVTEYGQADAFLGANVMCHIPSLHSVVEGIRILLKPEGVVLFEDPYLGDIIEKTSYDQIYDEHAFYFSAASISFLFGQHGMALIDVQPQHVHGGSMRYVLSHKGARPVSPAVAEQVAREAALGLRKPETFDRFRQNVERSRDDLMACLRDLRAQGKCIAGYAATSKSTTVINYCGITPELISYISDTTPIKQGKFSPGLHIPIRSYQDFKAHYPDYALLFGWNHADEIMANEQAFKDAGGKWIVYVPNVRVTE